jgi:hypothetical protein
MPITLDKTLAAFSTLCEDGRPKQHEQHEQHEQQKLNAIYAGCVHLEWRLDKSSWGVSY